MKGKDFKGFWIKWDIRLDIRRGSQMFYRPSEGHGLPHNPFNAIVAPRPIAWISSLNEEGVANLAPYSFFNAVAYTPPQVMYASTAAPADKMDGARAIKDTVRNIETHGEFVVNIATWGLKDHMNRSSAGVDHGVDEFELAGLDKAPGVAVSVPRVAQSPIQLECRHTQTIPLLSNDETAPNLAVFGEVVGIHTAEDVLTDGLIDLDKLGMISRLGYQDYARIHETFTMSRPESGG